MAEQKKEQKAKTSVVESAAKGAVQKKAAGAAAAKVAGSAIGSAIPGVGNAVGYVAGALAGKALDVISSIKAKITGNKSGLSGIIGGALLLGGLAIGGPVGGAVAFGGVMTGVGAMSAISTGVNTLGVGAAFLEGVTLITTFVITSLVGGFIFLIFLTALIVFIINAGAFVVPPGQGISGATGATEIVDCFVLRDFPTDGLDLERQAISLIGQSARFNQKLCAGGEIIIQYNPIQATSGGRPYGGFANGRARMITIYPVGLGSLGNTLYTLAHELGHVYDAYSDEDNAYLHAPGASAERPICTYPFQPAPLSESFAELISLYIGGPSPPGGFRNTSCLGGTLRSGLPNSWEFARSTIFEGDSRNW